MLFLESVSFCLLHLSRFISVLKFTGMVVLLNTVLPKQGNPFGKHGRCSQEISYCLATETPAKAELFKKLKII